MLVLVVLGRFELVFLEEEAAFGVFGDTKVAFGEDDDLLPRDVVLLYGLPDNLFAHSVAVCVRGVPRVQALVVGLL